MKNRDPIGSILIGCWPWRRIGRSCDDDGKGENRDEESEVKTIVVDCAVDFPQLRKDFRKALMTGGGMVAIAPEVICPDALLELAQRALGESRRVNRGDGNVGEGSPEGGGEEKIGSPADLGATILLAIAETASCITEPAGAELREFLVGSALPAVERAVRRRYHEVIREENSTPWEARRRFLSALNQGGEHGEGNGEGDIAKADLIKHPVLPADVRFLLERDPNPAVRMKVRLRGQRDAILEEEKRLSEERLRSEAEAREEAKEGAREVERELDGEPPQDVTFVERAP